jgi:hypothetical protein
MNIYFTLGSENISAGGQVDYLKCSQCDFKTFTLGLSADTDMVYQGVVGLTDLDKKRLLVTRLTYKEFINTYEEVPENLEKRINNVFNVESFKYFKVGLTFSRDSGEKVCCYSCPKCSNYLENSHQESFGDFIENGGVLLGMDSFFDIDNC